MSAAAADAPYWQALAESALRLPRCAQCQRWTWPAAWRCGCCGSCSQQWIAVEPHGRVYSWTRTHHAFAGAEWLPLPYVSLLVELPQAGGIRLLGALQGEEQPLSIGAAVRGVFGTGGPEASRGPVLFWRLESAS